MQIASAKCASTAANKPAPLTPEQQRLVLSASKYLYKYVARFVCKRPDVAHMREDLEQAGFLGLMRAAQLFDVSRGFTFLTFATAHVVVQVDKAANANKKHEVIREFRRDDAQRNATDPDVLPAEEADIDQPILTKQVHKLVDELRPPPRRNREIFDRRLVIFKAWTADPELTHRELARRNGVSAPTVDLAIRELSAALVEIA